MGEAASSRQGHGKIRRMKSGRGFICLVTLGTAKGKIEYVCVGVGVVTGN